MESKKKILALSFIFVILFSVVPVLATTDTNRGSDNSTNENNTVSLPTSNFTANVTHGTAPLKVLFTSNCTGNPTEFNWTFGEGTCSNQNIAATHTYTQPGKYEVSLTVTNAAGSNTATKSGYITVNACNISNVVPTIPCTNYTENNTNTNKTNNCTNNTKLNSTCNVSKTVSTNLRVLCSGKAPRRVHFIDRSKNHVFTYWNLGDGTTSKCKSVVHIYKKPGKYLVKFTVKYRTGKTKTVNGGYIVVT